MILKVFTVYDHAAKAYLQPFFLRQTEEAIRGFTAVVNQDDHMFGMYPDQYTLFELGEYDDSSAAFLEHQTPEPLGNGAKYKKIPQKPWSEEMTPTEPHYLKPGYPQETGISIKGDKCAQ